MARSIWVKSLFLGVLLVGIASAQTAVVIRNVNLRPDASINQSPITKLYPGTKLRLLQPDATNGYYHVKAQGALVGYVWAKNVQVRTQDVSSTIPSPLLATGHPVDWWFVFKLNSGVFPGCSGTAERGCIFGGTVQSYTVFGQQFVYASSETPSLQSGNGCAGGSTEDPVGATFDLVYNGSLYYVIWNDQFYDDPPIRGCGNSCGAPWGHSKGMIAWNSDGNGFVMQVTTPSWPASGSNDFPRSSDGNTLGCVKDNNVKVSQHFFALKLTKDDLLKVLNALYNASVVTDVHNPQIVKIGGPDDVRALASKLGVRSTSRTVTKELLSTGAMLISKPSRLNVPPWQMVSAVLGGVPLRTATWWANPKIYSTASTTNIGCWDSSLPQPGPVAIAMTEQWGGREFGLTGGPGKNFNHAKLGVAVSATHNYSIFGDMNQQGSSFGPNCASSQNGRGGLFYVLNDTVLAGSISDQGRYSADRRTLTLRQDLCSGECTFLFAPAWHASVLW